MHKGQKQLIFDRVNTKQERGAPTRNSCTGDERIEHTNTKERPRTGSLHQILNTDNNCVTMIVKRPGSLNEIKRLLQSWRSGEDDKEVKSNVKK